MLRIIVETVLRTLRYDVQHTLGNSQASMGYCSWHSERCSYRI